MTNHHPRILTFYMLPKVHKSLQAPPGTLDDCRLFVDSLNVNPWNIRLTSYFSQSEVEFLDLKLSLNGSRITTTLYRKPTSTNSLLHFTSFHPQHLKKGIPKGQFFGAKRNCNNRDDFLIQARDLTDRFKDRGYPKKVISNAFMTARDSDRNKLLQPRIKGPPKPLGIITTYNNQWRDIRGILSRHWGILLSEPRLKPHISTLPSLVARRARNIKDCLSHSHFRRPVIRLNRGTRLIGTFSCGNCNICPYMANDNSVTLPFSPFQIKTASYFNCKSRFVIYALVCPCPKVYVGQTSQELRRRMQQHFSNITTAKKDKEKGNTLTSVASHYLVTHNSQWHGTGILGLESVQPDIRGGDITLELLRQESKWIFNLNSLAPAGLNEDLLFTGFCKQN
ncbi:uncharacterized protein [Dendrobates tinctorius]|uniref:uncharacterized protein n=1 Tax=Dendrobates tinctorius TaxID=92724 RepID=UPI003CC9CE5F